VSPQALFLSSSQRAVLDQPGAHRVHAQTTADGHRTHIWVGSDNTFKLGRTTPKCCTAHYCRQTVCVSYQAGWGDADADAAPLNHHYDPELYPDCSAGTRRNLARVDETRIDLDLLEVVVEHIDASHADGAVLVFLPGESVETASSKPQRSLRI